MSMDLGRLMQQAQQMERKMREAEEQLAETQYEGFSGGDEAVKVVVNGRNEVLEVVISEDLMNPDDREMLQDMILIAVNDATGKAAADREEKLGALTQGIKLPGM